MDAHDLFKKLSVGAKFNVKRFRNDAEKFGVSFLFFCFYCYTHNCFSRDFYLPSFAFSQLVKKTEIVKPVHIKQEPIDEDEPAKFSTKRKFEENESRDETATLTLLEGISVPQDGSKRKKQKKERKELTVEKQNQIEKEKVSLLIRLCRS